jgi:hypothetical protein
MAGSFNFMLTVVDKSGDAQGVKVLGISVKRPTVDNSPVAVVVSPSSVTLAPGAAHQFVAMVSNTSNSAVGWSVSGGTISATGLFTAPKDSSTKSIQLTATSKADPTKQGTAIINVSPAITPTTLSFTASNLPDAVEGTAYAIGLHASGGTAPYRWNIASGSLPSGIEFAPSEGVVNGLTHQTGSFPFTASVNDAVGQSVSRKLTLHVVASNAGTFDGPAELPRAYVNSSMADTPAPGSTHLVKSGGNLQAALDSAKCGDTISLEAGATFQTRIVLPAKNCDDSHWIIIRTSASDAALPAEGTRLTPCYAGLTSLPGRPAFRCSSGNNVLAKLTSDSGNLITLANGANHFRLLGLELTRPASKAAVYNLVVRESQGTADHIVFDRVWLHGTAQDETTRGIMLAGTTHVAVVDSFFSDFHCVSVTGTCSDAQAIAGGIGDQAMGPYKIVNNYLEAAGENIIFGGGAATRTPEDIEIRRNFFFKPLIWMRGQPGFVGGRNGNPFIVKNHFELKNAQRVLFEGNVLENSWGGFSQSGFSILLTPKNQSGQCPLCVVHDVTIRYSTISHVGNGFTIGNGRSDAGALSQGAWNESIHDMIITHVNAATYGGGAYLFQETNGNEVRPIHDVVIDHVTGITDGPTTAMLIVGANANQPLTGFTWTNNIFTAGSTGIVTSGGGNTNCAFPGLGGGPLGKLDRCFKPYIFSGNILVGATGAWPKNNYTPASLNAVDFARASRDGVDGLQLQAGSPYQNVGTDGKNPGADVSAVAAAIAGVAP